jgi:signal transduction histidine kinase
MTDILRAAGTETSHVNTQPNALGARPAEARKIFESAVSPALRYGAAIGAVSLALLMTLGLRLVIQPTVYSFFFAAVIVSAWYGGLGPGLLATFSSALFLDYFFINSVSGADEHWTSFLRLAVFLTVALLTSSLTALRKRAEEALRKAHDELEMRVQERTAELGRANEILRDEIAERKEAESRLAKLTQELIERNKELWRLQGERGRVERLAALGRVTGTIAHELGTPLNSVLGYTQLLGQEPLSEGARRRLTIIAAQVKRMVEIIDQHLSRARTSLLKHRRIDLNRTIEETLELLKPIFQQHEVTVHAALAESLPALRGDEASLQRVLINLLDNAVDALQNGGRITVTTLDAGCGGKRPGAITEIADTGAGIAPELLTKVFDLFVTTKAPGKGTGLGLAICQEIVKGHGGTMEIESRLGEGTCVRIFLPADESAAGQAASSQEGR